MLSMRLTATFLLVGLLTGPGCAARTTVDSSAEDLYQQGLRAMKRGYYTKALEKFNRVRNYHRDDPLSVKAQLAIADMHFKKGDFEQARFAYEEFSSYHPRPPEPGLRDLPHRAVDLPALAQAWRVAISPSTRSAVNVWTGFDNRFPDSDHVEQVDQAPRPSGRSRLAAKELAIAQLLLPLGMHGGPSGPAARSCCADTPTPSTVPGGSVDAGRGDARVGRHRRGPGSIRERLSNEAPGSQVAVDSLDRALARPAGSPKPDEKVFIRPVPDPGPAGTRRRWRRTVSDESAMRGVWIGLVALLGLAGCSSPDDHRAGGRRRSASPFEGAMITNTTGALCTTESGADGKFSALVLRRETLDPGRGPGRVVQRTRSRRWARSTKRSVRSVWSRRRRQLGAVALGKRRNWVSAWVRAARPRASNRRPATSRKHFLEKKKPAPRTR